MGRAELILFLGEHRSIGDLNDEYFDRINHSGEMT